MPGNDVWNVNAPLLEASSERIRFVAQHFTDQGITFSAFRHSRLTRSKQTCTLLRRFMRSKAPLKKNAKLGPGKVTEWNSSYKAWKRKQDPENVPVLSHVEFAQLWPDLCASEGARVLSALSEIASEIKDGQSAAAIGHNPLVRLAQVAAFGKTEAPDVSHCQAIKFVWENGGFVSCEFLAL